ncbi:MAG: hypothetical protein IJ225_03575 [Solobacterium sp.]|nr:hypothetical protein [Solobacterium sp.]
MNQRTTLRLWLNFPAIQKRFECEIPLTVSFMDLIPWLNELFQQEFGGMYVIHESSHFFEQQRGQELDRSVTLLRQNLWEGICIMVV